MDQTWQRLLKLVRRTGDRLVVTDPSGREPVVLMGLEQYEMLVTPGANDSLEDFEADRTPFAEQSIDFDFPDALASEDIWTTPNETEVIANSPKPTDIWEAMPEAKDTAETWNISGLSAAESEQLKNEYEQFKKDKPDNSENGKIPPMRADRPATTPPADDFGEEQFYLEPIE